MTGLRSFDDGLMLAFLTLSLVSPARADIITVNPVADGYVTSPDDNPFPSSYTNLATSGSQLLLGGGGFSTVNSFRAALEFSLAALPAGSTINSATFSINQRRTLVSGITGMSFDLRTYSGDGAITLSDFPQTGAPVTSFNLTTGTNGYQNFDVTASLVSLLGTSASYLGVELAPQSVPAAPNIFQSQLLSAESPSGRPLLTIDYTPAAVPEPSTLILSTLAGLAVLTGVYANRRRSVRLAHIIHQYRRRSASSAAVVQ